MIYNFKISPGAKTQKIIGKMQDGSIKISIKSPPENGKANKTLIDFLSEITGTKKNEIIIISGLTSSHKQIKFPQKINIFEEL